MMKIKSEMMAREMRKSFEEEAIKMIYTDGFVPNDATCCIQMVADGLESAEKLSKLFKRGGETKEDGWGNVIGFTHHKTGEDCTPIYDVQFDNGSCNSTCATQYAFICIGYVETRHIPKGIFFPGYESIFTLDGKDEEVIESIRQHLVLI